MFVYKKNMCINMATGKIYEIVKQAIKTFSQPMTAPNVNTDFCHLVSLVNKLTLSDISLKRSQLKLDYQPVYYDDNVTIGVFILKEGHDIPIHDHPNMRGLLKVISGVLEITSYSLSKPNISGSSGKTMYYTEPLPAIKEPGPLILTKDDKCSIVEPVRNNIHRVVCVHGPAAFLDILSPPYDNDVSPASRRSCHYFKEHYDSKQSLTLIQIPDPDSD